jgi:hypothetical protein
LEEKKYDIESFTVHHLRGNVVAGKRYDWYVEERVESLAIMHLTRRPDLRVIREVRERDRVVDLLVEILDSDRPSWKTFGVELKGTKAPASMEEANKVMGLSLRRFLDTYGEPTFPYCLFYFTMDDGQGYVTWIAEPVMREGRPKLLYHRTSDCAPLDRGALDRVVEQVQAWYEAYHTAIKA